MCFFIGLVWASQETEVVTSTFSSRVSWPPQEATRRVYVNLGQVMSLLCLNPSTAPHCPQMKSRRALTAATQSLCDLFRHLPAQPPLLSPLPTLLQPHWSCCSYYAPDRGLSQGLCTGCSSCLEGSSPRPQHVLSTSFRLAQISCG